VGQHECGVRQLSAIALLTTVMRLVLLVVQATSPSRGDAPAAFVMAAFFFTFGLFAILRPEKLRAVMDNFANAWKQRAWHPYRMPIPVLRLLVEAWELAVRRSSCTSLTSA
jgi:hypothetical protein